MGGGGGSNTVEKSTEPWGPAHPYLTGGMDQAAKLAQQPIPYYQGSQVAQPDWRTSASIDMTTQRALNGSPVTRTAQDEATKTIGGAYLTTNGGQNPYTGMLSGGQNPYAGANPYLDQAIQKTQNDIVRNYQTGTAAQLDRSAAQANAFGSSGYQEAQRNNQYDLGRALGDASNTARMQDYGMQQQLAESGLNRGLQAQLGNAQLAESQLSRGMNLYNNERQRQIQASFQAPGLAQADYYDAGQLGNAGSAVQGINQANLNDYLQRYNQQAFMPYAQMDFFRNNILPFAGLGGTSQTTSPYASNGMATALGAGQLGLAAYNAYNAGLLGGGTGSAGLGVSGVGTADLAGGTFAQYAGLTGAGAAGAAGAAYELLPLALMSV